MTVNFGIWSSEDFCVGQQASASSIDIWDPPDQRELIPKLLDSTHLSALLGAQFISGNRGENAERGAEAKSQEAEGPVYDFWSGDDLPAQARHRSHGWFEDAELPHYNPIISENPFVQHPEGERRELEPEKRARWLLSLFGLVKGPTVHRHLIVLTDLFSEYSHHSTFRALSEYALDGDIELEELLDAYQLKSLLNDQRKLAAFRRTARGQGRILLLPLSAGASLSWSRACRIIQSAAGLPPAAILDEDWYREWLELPPSDPLSWNCLDYIEARLAAFAAGILDPTALFKRHVGAVSVPPEAAAVINNVSRTANLIRGQSYDLGPTAHMQRSHGEINFVDG